MSAFYISAAHKSSGKTTLSIGLAKAIRDRGLSIQTFKKGPDYIDPIWLSQASDRDCHNLDFFTSGQPHILESFHTRRQGMDVTLVEGNMGLFDGLALDGSDSNAAMARLLQLPVVLVVDCSGTSRGIAPLLLGYRDFDPQIRYAGVILNKVAGTRHEAKMRAMIERYTDFTVLGVVPRNNAIQVTERHLGLIPGNEMAEQAETVIDLLAEQAERHIDIDALLQATRIPVADSGDMNLPLARKLPKADLRVAIARDTAFGFYYPGDLQRFAELGVELLPFDSLHDPHLPTAIDGLFIGGGFPETQVEKLSANQSLLTDIRQSIEQGLPSYAECGGLMYLCRDLMQAGTAWPLCNVIPASVVMSRKPQGRGYVVLEPRPDHPWYTDPAQPIHAHEFHYSSLQYVADELTYGYAIKRGTGIDGMNDGIIRHNLVASYTHLRSTDLHSWVDDFVSFIRTCKEGR